MRTIFWKGRYFLLILVIFISKYNFIFNEGICLDGDQSAFALMIKHFSEGESIPLYLYGNRYGLITVQVFIIYLFSLVTGELSDIVYRLGILFVWSVGILFLYSIVEFIDKVKRPIFNFSCLVCFIFLPPWEIWSTMGFGYNLSFTLSMICIYFVIKWRPSDFHVTIVLGILMSLVYQAQPLWILGLGSFCIFYFLKARSLLPMFVILFTFGLAQGAFYFYKTSLHEVWLPTVFAIENCTVEYILQLPYIFLRFLIKYRFDHFFEIDHLWAHKIAGGLMMVGLLVTFINTVKANRIISKITWNLEMAALMSIVFSFGYVLFLVEGRPRYYLPFSGYAFLYMYIGSQKWLSQKCYSTYVAVLLVVLVFAEVNTMRFDTSNVKKEGLMIFIETLQNEDIHHVICDSWYLPWMITFYSDEKIIAIESAKNRYPPYRKKVKAAYINEAVNTAFVSWNYKTDKYTFIKNPHPEYLDKKRVILD